MSYSDSASAMPLLSLCTGPAILPHTEALNDGQTMGLAIHRHMQLRVLRGVEEAMRLIEQVAREFGLDERATRIFAARCAGFEWTPPAGALAEVALCLCADGTVVKVEGGAGHYPHLPSNAIVPGQIDVLWAEPEPLDLTDPEHPRCPKQSVLWVVDYKAGDDSWVDPVERNMQLATYVVMAARWTGAEQVAPAIVFVRAGQGEWDTPAHAWGPRELAAAEQRVRQIHARVQEQRARHARGEALLLTEGKHCDFCHSMARCPAKTAMIKSMLDKPLPLGDAPLTDDERVWLASRLRQIEAFARGARKLLVADVNERGPIVLDDGSVWGPVAGEVTTIDVAKALPILRDTLGDAGAVQTASISRDAIERQVRALHAEKGITRQLATTMRDVMAKIGNAGGLRRESRTEYRPHWPKSEAEEEALECDSA